MNQFMLHHVDVLTSRLFDLRPKRTLYSKKYGVDLIRYTHAANTVVYSSNKIDGMLHKGQRSHLNHSIVVLI